MSTRYASAVRQGFLHRMKDMPCQDRTAGSTEGPVSLAVLCDGAGSCPESELAAERVCRWALEDIPNCFDELYAMAQDELPAALVARGQAALNAALLGDKLCTMLLFSCHRDGRWLAAHIGDGYIFLREQGSTRVLSHPMNGRFLNETFFLCESDADRFLRTYRGQGGEELQALLTSDGCGDSLYDRRAGTIAPAVDKMCGWMTDYDSQTVSQALAHALADPFSQESHDDLSIAILSFCRAEEL